ncbi:ArsR/SmtB family transcription factor [Sinisalibacter aestuarii]|uniref:Transcriptional regulator n=1 Tax=Sinisalibacter aestuarii TaxID=2949426 RepID=A0ABQ5LW64_9RHOB|nr:metalloregulator ArsR/SmtB family transcription factor [Sinisalibacter aestuarii]GKY88496.1 transcriptional regulator [Sinisalibacter aestuarii]
MGNQQTELDAIFHALGEPTRRAVVQRLVRGEASVSELASPFDMGLPAFMKHLGVLEAAGLITSTKTGRTRICRIQPATLSAAESWFEDQRIFWQARYKQLDDLLVALGGKNDET